MRATLISFCVAVAMFGFKIDPPPRYDRTTSVEVTGRLENTRDVTEPAELSGVHLTVRCEQKAIDVYVAPSRFYKDLGVALSTGMEVRVRGSKVKYAGADLLLAREIHWDNTNTLTLRDVDGKPVW